MAGARTRPCLAGPLEKRALTAKLRCNAQRGAWTKSQKMSVRPCVRSEMAERPAREAAFAAFVPERRQFVALDHGSDARGRYARCRAGRQEGRDLRFRHRAENFVIVAAR